MSKSEIREAITLINEGEKVFGILHRPLNKEKVPAVLICSGFAGNKCGKHRLFVRLAQALSEKGVAVFRFDYRGAGDSEGDFKDITVDGKVSDTLACLKFLTQDPQIDPNRIGILGRSFGGIISILAAHRFNKIKSIALWAPVFNSVHWQELWKSYQSNQLNSAQQKEIQNLPVGLPNKKFIQQFFQICIEDELKTLQNVPLLHLEAKKDHIVNSGHGEGYRLARQNIAGTRFIQLNQSDHDFSDLNDQKVAIEETSGWFQETL